MYKAIDDFQQNIDSDKAKADRTRPRPKIYGDDPADFEEEHQRRSETSLKKRKFNSECEWLFKKYNIVSQQDFRKWTLKNHPDKGGDQQLAKKMNSCRDTIQLL